MSWIHDLHIFLEPHPWSLKVILSFDNFGTTPLCCLQSENCLKSYWWGHRKPLRHSERVLDIFRAIFLDWSPCFAKPFMAPVCVASSTFTHSVAHARFIWLSFPPVSEILTTGMCSSSQNSLKLTQITVTMGNLFLLYNFLLNLFHRLFAHT